MSSIHNATGDNGPFFQESKYLLLIGVKGRLGSIAMYLKLCSGATGDFQWSYRTDTRPLSCHLARDGTGAVQLKETVFISKRLATLVFQDLLIP